MVELRKAMVLAILISLMVSTAYAISAPPMPGSQGDSDGSSTGEESQSAPGSNTSAEADANTAGDAQRQEKPPAGFLGSIFSFFGGLF